MEVLAGDSSGGRQVAVPPAIAWTDEHRSWWDEGMGPSVASLKRQSPEANRFYQQTGALLFPAINVNESVTMSKRMQISEIPDDGWYKKDYRRLEFDHKYDTPLDDVDVVFHNSGVNRWRTMLQRRKKKNP